MIAPLNEVSFRATYIGNESQDKKEIFLTDNNKYLLVNPSEMKARIAGIIEITDLLDVRPNIYLLPKTIKNIVEEFNTKKWN